MRFRDRLLATIAAARAVLEVPGVLVVSQDLDIGVSIDQHGAVKERLAELLDFQASAEEPSVWEPRSADLLEINFVGIDPAQDPTEAYVLADDRLPLLVFGALSLLAPGATLHLAGTRVRLPRLSGLLLEKLITDRTGEKGERDLLVALGLLLVSTDADLEEMASTHHCLRPELRHVVHSNLTLLSLIAPRAGMPDPSSRRANVGALLHRLEGHNGP